MMKFPVEKKVAEWKDILEGKDDNLGDVWKFIFKKMRTK